MASQLRFTNELPPGAHVYGTGPRNNGGGVSKRQVEMDLRSNPGQWALVYENTNHRTAAEWNKRPGFESAMERAEGQERVKGGNARYRVWVRYVGDQPEAPPREMHPEMQAADAEPVPVQPVAPTAPAAPSAPAPLAPSAVTPPPRTAFQAAWDNAEVDTTGPQS